MDFEMYKKNIYKREGEVLRRLRKDAGYKSMEDFSDTIKMNRNQYALYERGKNMETNSLLYILFKHGISPCDFYKEVCLEFKNKFLN